MDGKRKETREEGGKGGRDQGMKEWVHGWMDGWMMQRKNIWHSGGFYLQTEILFLQSFSRHPQEGYLVGTPDLTAPGF